MSNKPSKSINIHCCDCQTDTLVSQQELDSYRGPEWMCDCGKVIDYDHVKDGVLVY